METQSIEKSQRITLGSGDSSMSESTVRKLNYIAGGLMMISSLYYIISFINAGAEDSFKIISGILFFVSAIMFLFRAQFELSPSSKYAPHFLITQNGLKIKIGVLKKPEFINWDEVKKVELGYYKIGIKDKTGLQYFPYKTRKETSIELKRAIEAVAAQKGIEVENLLKR
ncbi:hypothetical protein MATR_03800 [Marivirga tractuosa]|uniref:YcxB-like protein domain-containing protein n=1 Tax=Marivirga tractuosa (strain ATCC 23168 / DSM 4126 / NBRC 15989 / NCIMB 1408 / VKM B-1430 / H-43) TaxID=643867 RepID=E4TTT0_MARTH|nr:hypothetical protein [Marivirga tractuosa]ADR21985.1 hypothetical protein Ftrac_2000 [Marivirga tractuosa DSM 4126]BDD13555.1 hypothetical protein MATR_03800 [Marivirga tractuosa]